MPRPAYPDRHEHLTSIRRAATAAADAGAAVRGTLRASRNRLDVGGRRFTLHPASRVFVVGLGKAAPAMCRAAAAALGARLAAGIAAVPRSTPAPAPPRVTHFQAGHPLPNEGSLAAAQAAADLLACAGPDDLLLALVSGGGSAMFELPRAGVSLDDLRAVNRLLLDSGAPIAAFNTVRSALSRVKGGGLARLASPARTIGLILSDVVGDRISAIASGPTVLTRRDPAHARRILREYGLWRQVPATVRSALGRAPAASRCPRPHNLVVASNRTMVAGAAKQARALGFRVRVVSLSMHGEAREIGEVIARRLRAAGPSECLVMAGETTVHVRGPGRGGRNQELALSAALALAGQAGVALMAYASDGVDGPTDAAGAVIDGETAVRIGADARAGLDRNDAYPVLDAAGALIRCGPTGTNLADLVVGLKYAV